MAADEFDYPTCLAHVRQGDDGAARELVTQLYPVVLRVVRGRAPVGVAPEDLAQEVFLKMFSRLEQFRGESPLPHWVARIAFTTCLEHHRRRRARPELSWSDLSAAEQAAIEPRESAPANEGRDSVALVRKLLDTLDGPARLVVTLLDLEDKSVAEVGELMGWGASRVKITAWRARRELGATARRLRLHEELLKR